MTAADARSDTVSPLAWPSPRPGLPAQGTLLRASAAAMEEGGTVREDYAMTDKDGPAPRICGRCQSWYSCPCVCGWGWCKAAGRHTHEDSHRPPAAPCAQFADRWEP